MLNQSIIGVHFIHIFITYLQVMKGIVINLKDRAINTCNCYGDHAYTSDVLGFMVRSLQPQDTFL